MSKIITKGLPEGWQIVEDDCCTGDDYEDYDRRLEFTLSKNGVAMAHGIAKLSNQECDDFSAAKCNLLEEPLWRGTTKFTAEEQAEYDYLELMLAYYPVTEYLTNDRDAVDTVMQGFRNSPRWRDEGC